LDVLIIEHIFYLSIVLLGCFPVKWEKRKSSSHNKVNLGYKDKYTKMGGVKMKFAFEISPGELPVSNQSQCTDAYPFKGNESSRHVIQKRVEEVVADLP